MEEKYNNKFTAKDYLVLTLILVVGVLGTLSILRDRLVAGDQERFNVSAEGKIFAKPDIANITLSVVTDTQKEAQLAVQIGAEKMNAVTTELKNLGVEEADIKTTAYNLRPVYDYVKADPIIKVGGVDYERPDNNVGERIIVGYTLDQSLTVKIRNLEKIGEIIKISADQGANQTGGINFSIDDTDVLKVEARAEAIKKAQAKAEEIASASGLKLGKLVNVSETGDYNPVYRNDFAYAESAMKMASDAAIPDIESGNLEIIVSVNLTYKIK